MGAKGSGRKGQKPRELTICLLFELIESALLDLLVATKRQMKGARTPSERLRHFVQAFVAFNLREKHRLVLVNREFVNLDEEHRHQANQLKKVTRLY